VVAFEALELASGQPGQACAIVRLDEPVLLGFRREAYRRRAGGKRVPGARLGERRAEAEQVGVTGQVVLSALEDDLACRGDRDLVLFRLDLPCPFTTYW
jgi:hypothetical protein